MPFATQQATRHRPPAPVQATNQAPRAVVPRTAQLAGIGTALNDTLQVRQLLATQAALSLRAAAPVAQLARKSSGQKRKAAKEKKAGLALDRASREALLEEDPTATDTFHAFGDEDRDVEADPDETGGAHGVALTGNRPEDAPIVERFRVAYNQLDSWAIYLETKHPDLFEVANDKFDLDSRFAIVSEVKAKTKEYKEKFRDITNLDFAIDQANFEAFVEEQANELRAIITKVSSFVTTKQPSIDPKTVHEEGSEIWRAKWMKAVQQVNAIIAELWKPAEVELNKWILKQPSSAIKTKVPVGKLTYIGSLAKAYKGPPKQHIRFNPSDFDVDANLHAPSLAEYAMRHDKLLPDRGRIFGRLTGIKPLIAFADAVQREMVARVEGIEDNPDDVFDVVIEASATLEQEAATQAEAAAYTARENAL